jgi:NADH-quinone oxidoreductase subunit M
MIALSVLLPFAAAGLLLLVPRSLERPARWISFAVSLAVSILLGFFLVKFQPALGPQFSFFHPWLPDWGIDIHFAVDGLSLPFLLLTALLAPAGILYAGGRRENAPLFYALYLLLAGGASGLFLSQNLFFIFLFLEFEVLTAFFLITLWRGAGSERNGYQFVLFAGLAGLLILAFLGLIYFRTGGGSFELERLRASLSAGGTAHGTAGVLVLALAVLSSLFPFHAWGPLGYQAASRSVNALLVGIFKQAGIYLFLRLGFYLLPEEMRFFTPLLLALALMNILYVAWVAMAEKDPKLMCGYSGSSHMGFILLGLLCFSVTGVCGALLLAIGSGLSSVLLFSSMGRIEEWKGPFRFGEVSGLGGRTPFLSFMFSLGALAGAGLPGLLNFAGEALICFALFSIYPLLLPAAVFGVLLSAVYFLRSIKSIFHGEGVGASEIRDESTAGKWADSVLAGCLIALGALPMLILTKLSPAVSALLTP